MRISDFKFTSNNHFVAMEYYWAILNRTFLVLITENELIGIKVHGLIGVESADPLDNLLPLTVDGDLENPYSYISAKYIEKIMTVDLHSNDFLRVDGANFRMRRSEIVESSYDHRKKWGMGYYPHDGKVYVKTRDGKKREFIILGSRSGKEIRDALD